ncbi:MAG: flagellar biosynthesis protein FlgN [Ruegeria sp.]|uniref:flagellar biosynthesis protein FlgN n=1 Tax=Ruegeria sp. TaxID=1879320 RepID=UPI00349EB296
MTHDSSKDLITALEELLDLERSALIDGELDRLGNMMPEKEKLIEAINEQDDIEGRSLTRVHEKITRNQALLNSAMEGIRAVANRMAELRRVSQGLETYDSAGQKQRYPVRMQAKLEKRA